MKRARFIFSIEAASLATMFYQNLQRNFYLVNIRPERMNLAGSPKTFASLSIWSYSNFSLKFDQNRFREEYHLLECCYESQSVQWAVHSALKEEQFFDSVPPAHHRQSELVRRFCHHNHQNREFHPDPSQKRPVQPALRHCKK